MTTDSLTTGSPVDVVTREVVTRGLDTIAKEMGEVLGRSAYSPIIREMVDYSCAIFDVHANLVCQAERIPSQLGSMGEALRETIVDFPLPTWNPGDAFIANHPYRGGSHIPDVHIFTPVFVDEQMVAITATDAHHTDMGGVAPGSEGFDLKSIFAEGLIIPPMRLADRGVTVPQVEAFIAANVREPDSTLGDLRAQLAASRHAEKRVEELCRRYSPEVLTRVMADTMDYSERRMRAQLAALPDAEASASGYLDDDGLGNGRVYIRVAVRKEGDSAVVDFTGTDPQMQGPLNVPPAPTLAAVLYAFKCFVDPDTPQNQGCHRPLRVILPEGSAVNPIFPTAVNLRHITVQRVADTILRALTDMWPERAAAGSFVGFSSMIVDSRDPIGSEIRVAGDNLGGGMGASAICDGTDAVDTHMGNIAFNPAEITEQVYLLRVAATELIPDSGGAGKFRGGLGFRRVYEVLGESQECLVYTEQYSPEHGAWGLAGGHAGQTSRIVIERRDGTREDVVHANLRAEPGDRIVLETGGGGGYGDPLERDREAVAEDVRERRVSVEAAERLYGWVAEKL